MSIFRNAYNALIAALVYEVRENAKVGKIIIGETDYLTELGEEWMKAMEGYGWDHSGPKVASIIHDLDAAIYNESWCAGELLEIDDAPRIVELCDYALDNMKPNVLIDAGRILAKTRDSAW